MKASVVKFATKPPLADMLGDRLILVLNLRECEKKTYREIGKQIERSGTMALCLYRLAKRIQKDYEGGEKVNPYFGLSFRAMNICSNADFMDRNQITEAIKSGELHPTKQRNHGWKSYIEICEWAGLPTPIRP